MRPSRISDGRLTLADFQAGPGIPLSEQILLINNPRLFQGFTPCFYPWRRLRNRAIRYPLECFRRRLLYHPDGKTIAPGLDSDRIFAGYFDGSFDELGQLRGLYALGRSQPRREFTLIIGKGDYAITGEHLAEVPPNFTVYANNICVTDPRFRYVPMGRDFRSHHLFKAMRPSAVKTTLCYCNFSVSTHRIRETVHQMLRGKPFIRMEHMGHFLAYPVSREEYFRSVSASQFCICPRGNAVDTFRLWDAMYVGTIPIVVREAAFHHQLADLPILFLERYEDFGDLSARFLEDTYSAMQDKLYNYAKLAANHWLPPAPGTHTGEDD